MTHDNRPPLPGRLMTPGDVAAAFRVHPHTVTRWATAGKLPCIKTPGGQYRFREADVLAALNGGQR